MYTIERIKDSTYYGGIDARMSYLGKLRTLDLKNVEKCTRACTILIFN